MTVGPDDAAGTERLARYLLRPPLSLERMSLDTDGTVLYRRKARSRFGGSQTTFDAMDFLARVVMHVPQPKLHTVRYYGEYSSVARARRRAEKPETEEETSSIGLPSIAERRRLRRAWAQMIRRIYEVDPLTCRCGAQMRIVAFIIAPQAVTKILRHIDERDTARQRAPPASAVAS